MNHNSARAVGFAYYTVMLFSGGMGRRSRQVKPMPRARARVARKMGERRATRGSLGHALRMKGRVVSKNIPEIARKR